MLDLFNELIGAFQLFVEAFFTLEFASGISIGWILVAISVMGVVIYYLFGRTR